MDEHRLSRRRLLTAGAVIGAVPVVTAAAAATLGGADVPFKEGQANAPLAADTGASWTWFTDVEAAFITAATARLIPADDLGPGAVEAGVGEFLRHDRAGPAEADHQRIDRGKFLRHLVSSGSIRRGP